MLDAVDGFAATGAHLVLLASRPAPAGQVIRQVKPVDLSAAYGKPVYSLSIQECGGTRQFRVPQPGQRYVHRPGKAAASWPAPQRTQTFTRGAVSTVTGPKKNALP